MQRTEFEDRLVALVSRVWPPSRSFAGARLTAKVSAGVFRLDTERFATVIGSALPRLSKDEIADVVTRFQRVCHVNHWDLELAARHPERFRAFSAALQVRTDPLAPLVDYLGTGAGPALVIGFYCGRFGVSTFQTLAHLLSKSEVPIYTYLSPHAAGFWKRLVEKALPAARKQFLPISFQRTPDDRPTERRLLTALRLRRPALLFGFADLMLVPIGSSVLEMDFLRHRIRSSPFLWRLARSGECRVFIYWAEGGETPVEPIEVRLQQLPVEASSWSAPDFNAEVLDRLSRYVTDRPWEWHSWRLLYPR